MINGTMSKRVRMKQGLPQGSVLSPLLFVIFINDIVDNIPEGVEAPLFADDASVYSMDEDLEVAQARVQVAVSAIERWSLDNKLDLNVTKSCTFFFSTHTGEAKWRPNITLLGKRMPFGEGGKEKNPKFLGIILDRTLSFQDHVKDVCIRVTSRCKMLLCLASRSWGWKKRNLRRIYISTHRSIMDYAAPAWQPWLTPSQFAKLEVAQNRCLRAITGQYANTSVEILRLEANIPSYRTHSNQLIATAFEKGLRLPASHPRHEAITNSSTTHKLRMRSSLRESATKLVSKLSIANSVRKPLDISIQETWNEPERNWTLHNTLNIKKEIATIREIVEGLEAEITIYTDGSCTGGVRDGGAAAVITNGPFDEPVRIETLEAKGNVHTCSYEEEKRALLLGIKWLQDHPVYNHVAFCTDSLSLLQAMESDHPDTTQIRVLLAEVCKKADLVYVPGHCDIPGNELADVHAKQATRLEGPADDAVPFRTARAIIKKEICDPATQHHLAKKFYGSVKQERDHLEIKSRTQGTLLAQLRSGHTKAWLIMKHSSIHSKAVNSPVAAPGSLTTLSIGSRATHRLAPQE